jgi:hypothetical protein
MSLDGLSEVNYLAALVAAIAYFVLGALWYSPVLFSRAWIRASGVNPQEDRRNPAPLFALSVVANFVAAVALALLASATGSEGIGDGVVLGVVCGIGFAATAILVSYAFERRPAALQAINIGYNVLGIVVAAMIVTAWR